MTDKPDGLPPELAAMQAMIDLLTPLDADARRRVLCYICDRFDPAILSVRFRPAPPE